MKCRYATHVCQGVYHCNHIDRSLLEGCMRYAPSPEDWTRLAELESALDAAQKSTAELRAIGYVLYIVCSS